MGIPIQAIKNKMALNGLKEFEINYINLPETGNFFNLLTIFNP